MIYEIINLLTANIDYNTDYNTSIFKQLYLNVLDSGHLTKDYNLSLHKSIIYENTNLTLKNMNTSYIVPGDINLIYNIFSFEVINNTHKIYDILHILFPFICGVIIYFVCYLYAKYSIKTFSKLQRNEYFKLPFKFKSDLEYNNYILKKQTFIKKLTLDEKNKSLINYNNKNTSNYELLNIDNSSLNSTYRYNSNSSDTTNFFITNCMRRKKIVKSCKLIMCVNTIIYNKHLIDNSSVSTDNLRFNNNTYVNKIDNQHVKNIYAFKRSLITFIYLYKTNKVTTYISNCSNSCMELNKRPVYSFNLNSSKFKIASRLLDNKNRFINNYSKEIDISKLSVNYISSDSSSE